MLRLIALFAFLVVSGWFPSGASGTLIDQDYFTANEFPEVKELLGLVDAYHTDKVAALIREGRLNSALGDLKYALDRFPNHPRALQLLNAVSRLTKDPSVAAIYYKKALSLYPQYAMTHAQYGAFLVEAGRVDLGIAKLKHAVEMEPKLAAAHAWLAQAYLKAGDAALARESADRARALGYGARGGSQNRAK